MAKQRAHRQKKASRTSRFHRFSKKQILVFGLLFATVGIIGLVTSFAASYPYDDAGQAKLPTDPTRGLVYDGLRKIKATAFWHPCHGGFEVKNVRAGNRPSCTHGPDPAPVGVDMTQPVDGLTTALANEQDATVFTQDQIPAMQKQAQEIVAAATTGLAPNSLPRTIPKCYGDGSDARRVQLLLVNTNVRDAATLSHMKSSLAITSERVETQVVMSSTTAGITSPNSVTRHIRYVQGTNCIPIVSQINMRARPGYDFTYADITAFLQVNGYNHSDRKYLIWFDGRTKICGAGSAYNDSSKESTNQANSYVGYAVVGPACWNRAGVELHELSHTLGAVQLDAPHTSGGYHCLDEQDVMCYADGVNGKTVNRKSVYVDPKCTKASLDLFLDCNDSDYFNASTTISTGSYIYQHWNTANSGFLGL
ncbi:MAG: hypothetical protein JWS12_840 [Candidatus Saccharibacteria bacterium]|nr:hypothetical protein [Candidatus Saccharibacteria bacterium]